MPVPSIPKIDNDVDLMLDIFTHSSLRFSSAPLNDDYGDTARLAELGANILQSIVTYHFFSVKPNITVEDIREKRTEVLKASNLSHWLESYNLKNKLRANPEEIPRILADDNEMAHFFHVYVGAVYIRNGLEPVQKWISALIDPEVEVTLPGPPPPPPAASHQMHYGQFGQQGAFGQPGQFGGQQHSFYAGSSSSGSSSGKPPSYGQQGFNPPQPNEPPPPPPSGAPPAQPPPPPPPHFSYNAASTLSLVSLALVNQTASQQGISVTYPAEQTGPPHLPTWTVKCCMNGVERGRGIGKSMKVAKEEAARQAWASMGWGPS